MDIYSLERGSEGVMRTQFMRMSANYCSLYYYFSPHTSHTQTQILLNFSSKNFVGSDLRSEWIYLFLEWIKSESLQVFVTHIRLHFLSRIVENALMYFIRWIRLIVNKSIADTREDILFSFDFVIHCHCHKWWIISTWLSLPSPTSPPAESKMYVCLFLKTTHMTHVNNSIWREWIHNAIF
jgi:hypothetical protein